MGSEGSKNSFQKAALAQHNFYRKKHGVPFLKLDPKLTRRAQKWANHLAQADVLLHNPDSHKDMVGENIYMSSEDDSGKDAVDEWYTESELYTDYSREPTNTGYPKRDNIGHFTQVVWKDSARLGVAKATSSRVGTYVVANYSPAGNLIGKFVDNVFPPDA